MSDTTSDAILTKADIKILFKTIITGIILQLRIIFIAKEKIFIMLTGKNFIGEFLYGLNNYTFSVSLEIENSKTTYNFHEATAAEIDKAVTLAAQCFEAYRTTSTPSKIFFLESLAEAIAQSKELLVKVAMQET